MDDGLTISIRITAPSPVVADFTCASGELIALVGPSGAGKTTILRAIAGLNRAVNGRIACHGETWLDSDAGIRLPPHARRVGLVFQSYALFPHLTAAGNVAAALTHLPPGERKERAHVLLSLVHLNGLEGRKPAALSGGQQQRVALARALAREPHALLLDEPFSAVDRRTRRRLREELAELRATVRAPILLVTHDLDEAILLADRMIVVDRGEVLQQGPPADVMAAPVSDRVRAALDLGE